MERKKWLLVLAILVIFASGSYLLLYISADMGDDPDGYIQVNNQKTQSVNVTLNIIYVGNNTTVWTKKFTVGPDHNTQFEWPTLANGDYHMIVIAGGNRSDPYEFSSRTDKYNSQIWIDIQKDGSFEFSTVID